MNKIFTEDPAQAKICLDYNIFEPSKYVTDFVNDNCIKL